MAFPRPLLLINTQVILGLVTVFSHSARAAAGQEEMWLIASGSLAPYLFVGCAVSALSVLLKELSSPQADVCAPFRTRWEGTLEGHVYLFPGLRC